MGLETTTVHDFHRQQQVDLIGRIRTSDPYRPTLAGAPKPAVRRSKHGLEIAITHRIGEDAHVAAVGVFKCRPLGRLVCGALSACGKDEEKKRKACSGASHGPAPWQAVAADGGRKARPARSRRLDAMAVIAAVSRALAKR